MITKFQTMFALCSVSIADSSSCCAVDFYEDKIRFRPLFIKDTHLPSWERTATEFDDVISSGNDDIVKCVGGLYFDMFSRAKEHAEQKEFEFDLFAEWEKSMIHFVDEIGGRIYFKPGVNDRAVIVCDKSTVSHLYNNPSDCLFVWRVRCDEDGSLHISTENSEDEPGAIAFTMGDCDSSGNLKYDSLESLKAAANSKAGGLLDNIAYVKD